MVDEHAPAPVPPTVLQAVGGWAAAQVVNVLSLLALWAIVTLGLRALSVEWPNAIGFGFLAAFFGAYSFRKLVAESLGKTVAARVPGLVPPPAPQPNTPVEGGREVIETIVFVVVLVLMLKSFVAEAFVIPTGSMAETLWGYQKDITCPKCGHRFPVNASNEAEQGRRGSYVGGCTCPNCRQRIALHPPKEAPPDIDRDIVAIPDPSFVVGDWAPALVRMFMNGPRSGDRVLVSKYPYDLLGGPTRHHVVVFKFPGDDHDGSFPFTGPFKNHVPINYIKRLIGLPGETIAVHRGKVWRLAPELWPQPKEDAKAADDPSRAVLMWRMKGEWLHVDDSKARDLFRENKFTILQKAPAVVTSMMRIVYDNDLPATDLTGLDFQRWAPARDAAWTEDAAARSFSCAAGPERSWLRYRHVLRDTPNRPQLITDFMGYNTARPGGRDGRTGDNWVGDLIVEARVRAEKAEGTFALELSRGPSRFQAEFDVAAGTCMLWRHKDGAKPENLGTAPTAFKGAGAHDVRFANVDDRLIVWVDGALPFGDGVAYEASPGLTPTAHNDLEKPVSVGATGGRFDVRHLKVWRDTYYTVGGSRLPGQADVDFNPLEPTSWKAIGESPFTTYYVQPGHYLCLGDNSPESADSRSWGLVPARLMLGRAVLVYFPFPRVGRIR